MASDFSAKKREQILRYPLPVFKVLDSPIKHSVIFTEESFYDFYQIPYLATSAFVIVAASNPFSTIITVFCFAPFLMMSSM